MLTNNNFFDLHSVKAIAHPSGEALLIKITLKNTSNKDQVLWRAFGIPRLEDDKKQPEVSFKFPVHTVPPHGTVTSKPLVLYEARHPIAKLELSKVDRDPLYYDIEIAPERKPGNEVSLKKLYRVGLGEA